MKHPAQSPGNPYMAWKINHGFSHSTIYRWCSLIFPKISPMKISIFELNSSLEDQQLPASWPLSGTINFQVTGTTDGTGFWVLLFQVGMVGMSRFLRAGWLRIMDSHGIHEKLGDKKLSWNMGVAAIQEVTKGDLLAPKIQIPVTQHRDALRGWVETYATTRFGGWKYP